MAELLVIARSLGLITGILICRLLDKGYRVARFTSILQSRLPVISGYWYSLLSHTGRVCYQYGVLLWTGNLLLLVSLLITY